MREFLARFEGGSAVNLTLGDIWGLFLIVLKNIIGFIMVVDQIVTQTYRTIFTILQIILFD